MHTINSNSYWDDRFEKDWTINQGPAQSRFFAQVAIENLPDWLIEQIKQQSLTLVDWGCAQGDGTDVWASYIDPKQLVGVDFSPVAIKQATENYPDICFSDKDWLTDKADDKQVFDIVFSSNTLEHFHDPYSILETLCDRATKAVILVLPYQELDRHPEHFFTFLADNIQSTLPGKFQLVWSKVVDCRQIPETLWDGEQIILVYTQASWFDSLGLTLQNLLIEKKPHIEDVENLNKTIENLNKTLDERKREIADLVIHASAQNQKLIQVTNWAEHIDKHPIQHAFKKTGLRVARAVFRIIPVSTAAKQRLRSIIFFTINPLRKLIQRKSTQPQTESQIGQSIEIRKPSATDLRDAFVFAVIDWNFRTQRPQHIARSLAEGKDARRVFYFSNHFVDSVEPGYQLEQLPGADALFQVRLHVVGAPAIYFAPPSDDALDMLTKSIGKLIRDVGASSSISIVQHAYWYPLVKRLPNSYRVYDCMDHHEGFGNVPKKLVEIEKEMLDGSDLVTVTSSWLEDFAGKYNPSVAVVRNAAEYSHFEMRPNEVFEDAKKRQIIGYYGAIAEWFDLDLIRAIALEHSDCLVLLVGNDTIEAEKTLADLSNVEFTGEVPYSKLPFYLHAFDVCLLPFKVIPLTLATNPVKVYEYLSAGKPVVCVDLPEIDQFGDLVLRAKTIDSFVTQVNILLQESGIEAEKNAAKRRAFASEQTWHHRGEELSIALEAVSMPRVSVIILTFNNLNLTRACVDSVLLYNDYPNLEIIIVDNASSDGTPDYLEELSQAHPEIQIVLNSENLGFAAGNNAGLSIATGDYLVLLNNDTVVTQGWVMTLLRHFQRDPNLGIIGPVTNNIGNEAKIKTQYQNIADMPAETLLYTLDNMGKTHPMRTVAFFCAMLPYSIYEHCGPICEDYGRGFFEDDDYCRRIESIGKRIACAEDVFIHHHLSASFNKLKQKERQKLFDDNKKIYESKWGKWVAHNHRFNAK